MDPEAAMLLRELEDALGECELYNANPDLDAPLAVLRASLEKLKNLLLEQAGNGTR